MIPCDVTACRGRLYKKSAWMTEGMLIDWDRLGARTSLEFYPLCELERTDFIRPPHHLSSFNSVSSLFPDCGRLGERKKRTPVLFVGHDPEDKKRTLLVNGDVRH
ncbi:hypothetical protein AVEN_188086-1 [Araneus ventricosus]|uniref:Uncharacterized protein n=1 Tax=Araneus ventricosus TaxID=182803 RepID=A0A4Y2W668_ARAVE|nr:hypothetical protein AVEN_188086-1 [Araneus ventricosus]